MPITVTQGARIPNYPAGVASQRLKTAAQEAIGALSYADVFRNRAGTLTQDANRLLRVDMQNLIPARGGNPAQQNLQVQINGAVGGSTIAHANVSHSVMLDDPLNQTGVKNKVVSALNRSLDTACSFTVSCSIP